MNRNTIFILLFFLLWSIEKLGAQSPSHATQSLVSATSLTIAQDGSGNFKTIQEAVNTVRDLSKQRVIIHIKNGIYHEKIVVPSWKTNISFVGESEDSTIITNNDYSGKPYPGGADASRRSAANVARKLLCNFIEFGGK